MIILQVIEILCQKKEVCLTFHLSDFYRLYAIALLVLIVDTPPRFAYCYLFFFSKPMSLSSPISFSKSPSFLVIDSSF